MITVYHLIGSVPAAFFGIVGLWASGSARHWFVRTGVVGIVLLVMLFIPAYEILIQFTAEVLLIVAGMAVWRRFRRRGNGVLPTHSLPRNRYRPQLSLEALLLFTAVVAVLTAVIARAPTFSVYEWYGRSCIGVAGAAMALASVWLACGSARGWLRLLAALPLVYCLGVAMYWLGSSRWIFQNWMTSYGNLQSYWQSLVQEGLLVGASDDTKTMAIGVLILTLWLMFVTRAGWFHPFREVREVSDERSVCRRSQGQNVSRWAAATMFGGVGLVTLYLFYRLLTPSAIPDLTSPRPNGYDELVAAGRSVQEIDRSATLNVAQWSVAKLRRVITINAAALEKGQAALQSDCRFPLIPADEVSALFGLRHVLYSRWLLAAKSGTVDERVAASLDLLRFSFCEARSAGTNEFMTIATPFEYEALDNLWQNRSALSAAQCVALANELHRLDLRRATWEERVARQRIIDANSGWERHLGSLLEQWSGQDHNEYDYIYRLRIVEMQVLILDLSIRAFKFKNGRLPGTLEELVPEFTGEVPADPFSKGDTLRYKVTGDTYQLYSVGPNGIDDGGQPLSAFPGSDGDVTEATLYIAPIIKLPALPTDAADSTDDEE